MFASLFWVATCHSFIIFFAFLFSSSFGLLAILVLPLFHCQRGRWGYSLILSCHIFYIFLFLNPCLCPSSMVDLILHSAYLPCLFSLYMSANYLSIPVSGFVSLSVLPFCTNISTLFDIVFFFFFFFWLFG